MFHLIRVPREKSFISKGQKSLKPRSHKSSPPVLSFELVTTTIETFPSLQTPSFLPNPFQFQFSKLLQIPSGWFGGAKPSGWIVKGARVALVLIYTYKRISFLFHFFLCSSLSMLVPCSIVIVCEGICKYTRIKNLLDFRGCQESSHCRAFVEVTMEVK